MIYLRTKEGRIARESPEGRYIPHDGYMAVENTDYIQRLLTVHKDVEQRPDETATTNASKPVNKESK